jgi:hypothetical protein
VEVSGRWFLQLLALGSFVFVDTLLARILGLPLHELTEALPLRISGGPSKHPGESWSPARSRVRSFCSASNALIGGVPCNGGRRRSAPSRRSARSRSIRRPSGCPCARTRCTRPPGCPCRALARTPTAACLHAALSLLVKGGIQGTCARCPEPWIECFRAKWTKGQGQGRTVVALESRAHARLSIVFCVVVHRLEDLTRPVDTLVVGEPTTLAHLLVQPEHVQRSACSHARD